jgi:hypothetical protein
MEQENPYEPPLSALGAEKPRPPARWRTLVSTTVFIFVAVTSTTWSWYPDKCAIAMACLLIAALIRWWPLAKTGRSFRPTRYPKNP